MLHIDFSEDCVSVIREHNTSHGVEKHLKHALWTKGCSNNVRNGFRGLDVGCLGLLALLSLCIFVENVYWGLHILIKDLFKFGDAQN